MVQSEQVAMNLAGLIILYILAGIAKTASVFNVGPQWLRQFKVGKTTIY